MRGDGVDYKLCVDEGSEGEAYEDGVGEDGKGEAGEEEIGNVIW